MAIFGLYGTMNPSKRLEIYEEFCRKEYGILLATDVAARGLDFPSVSWVVQLDAPPDAEDYIHRCGRTARYQKEGEALLLLTPSQEAPMLQQLEHRKVPPLHKIHVNEKKIKNVVKKLEVLCAKDANLKNYAQKCFVSYLRSVYLMKNKDVFNVQSIAVEKLAQSLGLAFAPRVRFLRKQGINLHSGSFQTESPLRMNVGKECVGEEEEQASDLFTVSKKDVFGAGDGKLNDKTRNIVEENVFGIKTEKLKKKSVTREDLAKKLLKKKKSVNKKIVYGDDEDKKEITESDIGDNVRVEIAEYSESVNTLNGLNIEEAKKRMHEADRVDRKAYRQLLKAKKKQRGVVLGSSGNSKESGEESYNDEEGDGVRNSSGEEVETKRSKIIGSDTIDTISVKADEEFALRLLEMQTSL